MATTDIFRSIMIGHDEVDVTKAISVGMESTGEQCVTLHRSTVYSTHKCALMLATLSFTFLPSPLFSFRFLLFLLIGCQS